MSTVIYIKKTDLKKMQQLKAGEKTTLSNGTKVRFFADGEYELEGQEE